MTIISTANGSQAPDTSASILAEFDGGQNSDVQMMIGVGVVKDSEAVFFQYLGEKQHRALILPTTGKPLTRLPNVRLVGISVAEDIGSFKATKLNLFLETNAGTQVMVTAGLQTIWSQCVITGLMGLEQNGQLLLPFNLDSWKGDSMQRPCFASIRIGRARISDQGMYDQLKELRSDGAKDKVLETMRNAVAILSEGIGQNATVDEVTVEEVESDSDNTDY